MIQVLGGAVGTPMEGGGAPVGFLVSRWILYAG